MFPHLKSLLWIRTWDLWDRISLVVWLVSGRCLLVGGSLLPPLPCLPQLCPNYIIHPSGTTGTPLVAVETPDLGLTIPRTFSTLHLFLISVEKVFKPVLVFKNFTSTPLPLLSHSYLLVLGPSTIDSPTFPSKSGFSNFLTIHSSVTTTSRTHGTRYLGFLRFSLLLSVSPPSPLSHGSLQPPFPVNSSIYCRIEETSFFRQEFLFFYVGSGRSPIDVSYRPWPCRYTGSVVTRLRNTSCRFGSFRMSMWRNYLTPFEV